MLNKTREAASELLLTVVDAAVNLLRSRKFTLAVAGFVASVIGVPTEALVPLVTAIVVEGVADVKSR